MALRWLIVGGGIHGVHIAVRLIGEVGIPPAEVRIVDPNDRLLQRWRDHTRTVGMSHLRSPSVHHLDIAPGSLRRFAGRGRRGNRALFAGSYGRPTLALFNAHCDRVIEAFGLDNLHVRDSVTECSVDRDGAEVGLSQGLRIAADNIVLAVGASDQPRWPKWAPRYDPRVCHVFDSSTRRWPSSGESVAVIGGGTSAAQVALRLARAGHKVHLVSRHELREHRFDTDPGWLGPKFMTGFGHERDVDRRRSRITEARHTGSVPPAVRLALCAGIMRGRIAWHRGEVEAFEAHADGLSLRLNEDRGLRIDHVVLATGFTSDRPGGAMVDSLVASAGLRCARCGYPVVDSALRWHPRVRVSGPLAELELGPVARNIAGARRAGDRLVNGPR